jgi:hypothetical protein
MGETDGDRKARDLTELPLADLSEAFTTGASSGAKKVSKSLVCNVQIYSPDLSQTVKTRLLRQTS